MKFKNYLASLNKMAELHPETLEFEVVYSSDEEGNTFNRVVYEPTIGVFNGPYNGEFYSGDDIDEDMKPNAVCLN